MKKTYTLIFISIIILSCSKSNPNNQIKNRQLSAVDFETYGQFHNQKLEGIYVSLHAQRSKVLSNSKNALTRSTAIEISKATILRDADKNLAYSPNYKQIGYNLINSVYSGDNKAQKGQLYSIKDSKSLTSKQISVLNELNSVINNINSQTKAVDIQNQIISLEKRIPTLNMTVSEQRIVYVATSVAKGSNAYWEANALKWHNLNNVQLERFDGRKILSADVAGAVGGAIYASWMNFAPGAGQVAYGSAISGSAAAGSGAEAVMQIFGY